MISLDASCMCKKIYTNSVGKLNSFTNLYNSKLVSKYVGLLKNLLKKWLGFES
jgi:hypothetical protein